MITGLSKGNKMKKSELIFSIKAHDPQLVWDIDDSNFYGCIGWAVSVRNTYWYDTGMQECTNKILKE